MKFVDNQQKNLYRWVPASIRRRGMYLHPKRIRYIVVAGVVLLSLIPAGFISQLLTKEASAFTASQGPRFATATGDCVNDASLGTVAWTTPGNAFSTNSTYASATVDGTTSNYIKCTNFGFSIPTGVTISGIVVSAVRKSSSTGNGGSQDAAVRLVQNGVIGATDRSTATIYTTADAGEDHGTSTDLWGGTWTSADINATNFGAAIAVKKASAAGAAHTVTVDSISITVHYSFNPTFTQSGYRWFDNQDASGVPINVGLPLSALNTAAVIAAKDTIFRLRLNVHVGNDVALAGTYHNFKLRYAQRGSDNTCDTGFVNETYTDVTTSTPIAYANNTNAVDGQALAANANDPTHGSDSIVYQDYHEATGMSVVNNVSSGQDAIWDFALKFTASANPQSYCLRMVTSTGSSISAYTVIPEVSLLAPITTQDNYRFFANTDSTAPGTPLAAQDTPVTIAPSTPFRFRQLLSVTDGTVAAGQQYKMQFATKNGTCSASAFGDLSSTANTPLTFGTNFANDGSTYAWASPELAGADDNQLTTVTVPGGVKAVTNYLNATGFGFSIPLNATITGVAVTVDKQSTVAFGATAEFIGLFLLKGGIKSGSDHTPPGTPYTAGVETYGTSTDLWGTTLTPADVNSPGFGVSMSGYVNSVGSLLDSQLYVDYLAIRVYYSVPLDLQFHDNASIADGATIASAVGDPVPTSGSTIYQTYSEASTISVASQIANGQSGLWDTSLITNEAALGKTYCLRYVNADNTPLDNYQYYPEFTVGNGASVGPTLTQQMRGGGSVINGTKGNLIW